MYRSIETECVQAGYSPANGEPRVLPIIQSTTFAYDTPEEMGELFDLKKEGFFYTRLSNPTSDGLERKITALEGGSGAMAVSSGMSATTIAILTLAGAGDNFISVSTIYGGTYNLFNITLRRLGIDCRFVSNDSSEEDIEKLIDDKTRAIFIETIANPAGVVADFEKFSAIAGRYGIVLIADNTIATPVLCRPVELGANVVVHSNINAFGAAAAAGCGAYSKIEGFAFLPITSFALSMSTFVSQNLGAKRFDRVKSGTRFGILCSISLAELIGLSIFLLAPVLIAAFNDAPEVVSYGTDQARTIALFYCMLAFSHCAAGIMRGAGKAAVPMLVMLVCWCLIRVSYITLAVHFLPDIHVVFWAYPLTWSLSSIVFLCYMRYGKWMKGAA